MHFERRRINKANELEDDARNEIKEDSDADENDMDQNYSDLNSTEVRLLPAS